MTSQFALVLRVMILYPLAGFLGALPSVSYDDAAGLLTIDVNALSVLVGGLIWVAVSGSTFAWSRWAKRLGWAV